MKGRLRLFAVVLAAALAAAAFAACKPQEKNPDHAIIITISGTETQTVGYKEYKDGELLVDEEYIMSGRKEFLGQILEELHEEEELHIVSDAGFYSEVGTLVPDASKNEFVAFYTTSEDPALIMETYTSKVLGVTYYSSGVGCDAAPAADGIGYLFFIDIPGGF